ncbi:MAG: hypothetical protein WC740_16570 [Verrucomicrobiia bacterium]
MNDTTLKKQLARLSRRVWSRGVDPMMKKTLLIALAAVLGFASVVSATPRGSLPNSDPADPYGDKPRPPFMIPEGTANLALHKTVTSSTAPTKGSLKMITDGEKEMIEEYTVELPQGKQWVQVDLTETAVIYAVLFWLGDDSRFRSYHDVVVQVSDDKEFKKGVKIIFNNDHDNSSGFGCGKDYSYGEDYQGKLVDAKGVSARYVRINTNGNTVNLRNHFAEIEVWGLAGKKPGGKMVPLNTRFPKPYFR